MKNGSLDIVGVGIQVPLHTSSGAHYSIKHADKVLYVLTDEVSKLWVTKVNPTAEDLHDCYKLGRPRSEAYLAMVERILKYVRQGLKVTFVSYGHPGIFCFPAHEALKQCRVEGYSVRMFPSISSQDCLFCDLDIDPAIYGVQSFDATEFLIHDRKCDTSSGLILWQISVIGVSTYEIESSHSRGLKILIEYLTKFYPPTHEVIIYEAAQYPVYDPIIQYVTLDSISNMNVAPLSTLYIPPYREPTTNLDTLRALGISE